MAKKKIVGALKKRSSTVLGSGSSERATKFAGSDAERARRVVAAKMKDFGEPVYESDDDLDDIKL
jgi:hypothetical protein